MESRTSPCRPHGHAYTGAVAGYQEHLREWLGADLIDRQAADRIREFESSRDGQRGGGPERPGAVEAVLYLGMAAVAVGAVALVAQNWTELRPWGRVSAPAVPGTLALGLGLMLRSSGRAELRRASHVALAVSLALLTAAAVALGREVQGTDDFDRDSGNTMLVVAAVSVVLAVALWAVSPSDIQVLALGGSLFFLCMAMADWADGESAKVAGATMLGIGVPGMLLTEVGLMRPAASARLVFGLALAGGPYIGGIDGTVVWGELGVFVAAAVLLALSVIRGSFTYMAIGAGAAFVGLVTFIFEHFEDDLGAPLALILSGGILIAAVLGLVQARSLLRGRGSMRREALP